MDPKKTESVADESSKATETYEQQVNRIVSTMTQDKEGNFQLPEGDYSDAVKYSVNAERRRRSTESALSKTRLQLKTLDVANTKLKQIAVKSAFEVSTEDQKTLEELKFNDPDAWYAKKTELELSASASLKTEFETINSEALQQAVIESRITTLKDFNKTHPDANFTDDLLETELPPRIWDKLKAGKVTFEKFLIEAHTYITTPKVIDKSKIDELPNLGKTGGRDTPSKESFNRDSEKTYANATF